MSSVLGLTINSYHGRFQTADKFLNIPLPLHSHTRSQFVHCIVGNIVDPFTWRQLLYDVELQVPKSSGKSAIGHSSVNEFRKPMKANGEW